MNGAGSSLWFALPDTPLLAATLVPPGRELRFPSQHRVAQPKTSCWRRMSCQGQRGSVLPRRVHPAETTVQGKDQPSSGRKRRGPGGRTQPRFPGYEQPVGATRRVPPFVSGVGAGGQKMSPCTSLPRSSRGPARSPREKPTQSPAHLGRPESTHRRGLSGCPGWVRDSE